jgi:hypothetical protein
VPPEGKYRPPPKESLYKWVPATVSPTVTATPTPPLAYQELGVRSKELGGRSEKNTAASPPPVVTPQDEKPKKSDPAEWMHALWNEVLGNGRDLALTPARRTKYREMFEEQLQDSSDPVMAFRAVLVALTRSDWHMSKRAYQFPESFLKNAERRSQWLETAREMVQTGGAQSKQRQNVIKLQEHFARRNSA